MPPDLNDVIEILQCIGTIHQGFRINDFCRSTWTQFLIGPLTFLQVDYGISFLPFLEGLDDRLLKSPAALETSRCFFLHLGVGTGIHPFALQEVFRRHCERLRCFFQVMHKDLPASEDYNLPIKWDKPINDLLQKGHYINFEILRACWPLEFDSYRILLFVDRAGADPYFLLLDPSNDKSSKCAEVVLRFDGSHFTLLIGQTIAHIIRSIEESQNQKNSAKFLVVPSSEFLHTGSWQPGRARCSLQALEQDMPHLSPACSSSSHLTTWEKDIVLKDKDRAFEAVLTCSTADKRTTALAVVKRNADVERLVDMGFQRDRCQQALYASGGDVEQAVKALLTPPAGSSVQTDSNQLQHLLSMGYPRERCVQALEVNMNCLESAVNWINDMQPSNPGVYTDDVQRLLRMGFSANDVARMTRRLQQQLQNQSVAEARLELVLYSLLEPYRIRHLQEMEENPPIRQLTAGGGNCCFHALLCALGHLQQSTGYNFRERALPLDHAGMRKAIVDFESRNLNANDLFLFGLVWLNPLSQFIGPDPQTHLEVRNCSALCYATSCLHRRICARMELGELTLKS